MCKLVTLLSIFALICTWSHVLDLRKLLKKQSKDSLLTLEVVSISEDETRYLWTYDIKLQISISSLFYNKMELFAIRDHDRIPICKMIKIRGSNPISCVNGLTSWLKFL